MRELSSRVYALPSDKNPQVCELFHVLLGNPLYLLMVLQGFS
jgi:hypothetical protein